MFNKTKIREPKVLGHRTNFAAGKKKSRDTTIGNGDLLHCTQVLLWRKSTWEEQGWKTRNQEGEEGGAI